MKNRNGNLVSDPKMIVENFKEYFDNLLNDSAEKIPVTVHMKN